MLAVTVRLLDDGSGTSVILNGNQTASGSPVTLTSLVVRRSGTVETTLNVSSAVELPADVIAADGSASQFRLQRPSTAFHRDITFNAVNPLFGITFDIASGVRVVLRLRLLPSASEQPAWELLVAGGVKIGTDAGSDVFSPVALGYCITKDDVPASFPCPAPDIKYELPGDLPWPTLRLPWSYPLEFASVEEAFTLPAYRVPLISDHLTLGWENIVISGDVPERALVVLVKRLRATGLLDLYVTLRITFGASDFDIEPIEDSNQIIIGSAKLKRFAPGCFGMDAKAKRLTPLLSLAASEFVDDTADSEYKLRVHAPDGRIEEVRLDWAVGAANRTINAPGFKIDLQALEMLSVVLQRPEDEPTILALVATFSKQAPVKISTAFGWTSAPSEQERFRDADPANAADPGLIGVTFDVHEAMSVALAKIAFGGGSPVFLQRLETPLPPLSDSEEDRGDEEDLGGGALPIFTRAELDQCPHSDLRTRSLSLSDISNPNLLVDGKQLKLPFLDGPKDQLLRVLGIDPPTPTPAPLAGPMMAPSALVIERDLRISVNLGGTLQFATKIPIKFDLERLAFDVDPPTGIDLLLPSNLTDKEFLGLKWTVAAVDNSKPAFRLVLQNRNYAIQQLPNTRIVIAYDRATMPEEPIEFHVNDFVLGHKGLTLTAKVSDKPARLNGLETQFRFTEGMLKIVENKIAGFAIGGTGPMPPALIDNAVVDAALQFEQVDDGNLRLVRGRAEVRGPKLLNCKSTRFEFELDGVGLEFIHENGADHLYFTLSGKARYKLAAGDDTSGPLAWLPGIEIQLVNCPLTGNMKTIAKHVNFQLELPKKVRFSFLGCFTMEIRALGFVPQFDKLDDRAAMRISGQIMFADTGDVLEAKVDLHDLYVALPDKGQLIPRLYLRRLGVRIAQGETFALEAAVEFYNGEEIEPGIPAHGFIGEGSMTIKGLPTMAATFAWLRVSNDGGQTWKRAWFIYVEARRMSIRIPVVEIYIREIGLGFGYRYTLAAFKEIDKNPEPKVLLKKLKEISKTQGNLSRRDQWRVDLEEARDDARWTVVFRALFASSSAQTSPFTGYEVAAEKELPSLYIFDAVLAVRSDLTFFLAGRAWLNTNYNDYNSQEKIRNAPLLNGFMMLSPRQSRFLANLSSNPGAEFGDHPPLPDFLKELIRGSKFSATLLIEPGLVHYELGWPNQLQLNAKLGPLQVQLRAGTIFRVSTRELVVGNSFLARGKLELKAEFSAGFFGAGLYALADVAYGARYIGVLAFDDPKANSALYGGIGLEIKVRVDIRFWLRLKIGFFKISINLSISFELQFTAALQVGILLDQAPGALGTATLSVRIMGRSCSFNVRVGINDGAVEAARGRTEKFLKIGLEAEDVEAIPGTSAAMLVPPGPPAPPSPMLGVAPLDADGVALVSAALAPTPQELALPAGLAFAQVDSNVPKYYLGQALATFETNVRYVVLLPRGAEGAETKDGFYAVPPDNATNPTQDFELTWAASIPAGVLVKQHNGTDFVDISTRHDWKVKWDDALETVAEDGTPQANVLLRHWMRLAYVTNEHENLSQLDSLSELTLKGDPEVFTTTPKEETDARVQNPTDAAFEAAVRGATEQFAGPYFKFDPDSPYDASLGEAYRPGTSVYTADGKAPDKHKAKEESQAPTPDQCAIETRSSICQAITRDVFRFADLPTNHSERQELIRDSLAFRLGVIFRIEGPELAVTSWLEANGGKVATLRQRNHVDQLAPTETEVAVDLFNPTSNWFSKHPPEFDRVRTYSHASTIAIDWRLTYPPDVKQLEANQGEIEHHLRYYRVRREHLDGNDPTRETTVKPADVLHRDSNGDVFRLPPRFQYTDHFDDRAEVGLAPLNAAGKMYLYTITPVDIAGNASERPLTVVATRYPAEPPLVPTDGELLVQYKLKTDGTDVTPTAMPEVYAPDDTLTLRFSDPVEPVGQPIIPAKKYFLIFRREAVLPVGFYGADENVQGLRHRGQAVNNARRLRTDISIPCIADGFIDAERSESGRAIRTCKVLLKTLKENGIYPKDGAWRPEGWTVFLQAEGVELGDTKEGVRSSLAAVVLRFQFGTETSPFTSLTERRLSRLEWLPRPVCLNLLGPTDVTGEPGYAKVPMPALEGSTWEFEPPFVSSALPGLSYEQHPDRLRAIKLIWNQGPNAVPEHPLAIHARYQVYEYAVFDHVAEKLRPDDTPTIDFPAWASNASLQKVQEVDLLPSGDKRNAPTAIGDPQAWEAWYPSTSQRLLLKKQQLADKTWPADSNARYGAWYSFRESVLEWPALTGLVEEIKDTNNKVIEFRRLCGFHPYLENVAAYLGRTRVGELLPNFFVETGPQPPRIDDRTNAPDYNPVTYKQEPTPGARDKYLANTAPEVDPYGWGVLQRMGLAMGLRVRDRKNDTTLVGAELHEELHDSLEAQKTHRRFVYTVLDPNISATLTITAPADSYAYRWSVARVGSANVQQAMEIGGTGPVFELPVNTLVKLPSLINASWVILDIWGPNAEPTIELGPNLSDPNMRKDVHYQAQKFLHVEQLIQPGQRMVTRDTEDASGGTVPTDAGLSLIQLSLRPAIQKNLEYQRITLSGVHSKDVLEIEFSWTAAAIPIAFIHNTGQTASPVKLETSPIKIKCVASLEGTVVLFVRAKDKAALGVTATNTTEGSRTPIFVSSDFLPTDWPAAAFTSNLAAAQGAQWDTLKHLVRMTDTTLTDADFSGDNNVNSWFSWLDRFFAYGGAVDLATGKTKDIIWTASGYPRASSPLPLAPDAAGRITSYRPIESLWGQAYRYYVRPRGRYELLWEEIGRTPELFEERGIVGRLQTRIARPDPGGADVALPRIRPVAAPLVLSSRRLDLPTSPGSTTPPGAVWEVFLAGHSEQDLIVKNQSLQHHTEFRQIAVSLVRQFSADAIQLKGQATVFANAASGHVRQATDPFAGDMQTLTLWYSATDSVPIDRGGDRSLLNTINVINSQSATTKLDATPKDIPGVGTRLVLRSTISGLVNPHVALKAGEVDLVGQPQNLPQDLNSPVLKWPTDKNSPHVPAAGLPAIPSSPDHLDFGTLSPEAACSIDIPMRSTHFGRGALVLQYQALPFYYSHKMLAIAQTSHVVSPITTVVQRDFEYLVPELIAEQEGILNPDGTRDRRIVIPLARYWDCLPVAAQKAWPLEQPHASDTPDLRRPGSLPDPDVIYSIALKRPASGNLEIVAEYRIAPFDKNTGEPAAGDPVTGYQSIALPGPFNGSVVRLNPAPLTNPAVDRATLETILQPVTPPGEVLTQQAVSSRRVFVSHPFLKQWPTTTDSFPRTCELVVTLPNEAAIAGFDTAVRALLPQVDSTFGQSLRELLAQPGLLRRSAASIGLEQLAELHDSVTVTPIFGDAMVPKQVVWRGLLSKPQKDALSVWLESSPFKATFQALLDALESHEVPSGITSENNVTPAMIAASGLAARLRVDSAAGGNQKLVWTAALTQETTADELTKLSSLVPAEGNADRPTMLAWFAAIQLLGTAETIVPIVEPFWRPRPTQVTLPSPLADSLLIGNGIIVAPSPLTRTEGLSLLTSAATSVPESQAVRTLYARSMQTGFADAVLQLFVRRGSATPTATNLQATL
jgi:hypothetical protein